MEVLLVQDVERLGKAGAVLVVKDGFARNLLIPRGWAIPAIGAAKRRWESENALRVRKGEALKKKARGAADQIGGILLKVPVAVGDQGKIHGAVTAADLLEGLRRLHGVVLDKHEVLLEHPLTQLGTHEVAIRLHPEVTATLKVQLIRR